MNNIYFSTDTGCDIMEDFADELSIKLLAFPIGRYISENEYYEYEYRPTKSKCADFYDLLDEFKKDGIKLYTNCFGSDRAFFHVRKYFDLDADLLHFSLSSGLSGTHANLNDQFETATDFIKTHNFINFDTKSASCGNKLLLDIALHEYYVNNKNIFEIVEILKEKQKRLNVSFFTDTSYYLKQNGRLESEISDGTISTHHFCQITKDGRLAFQKRVQGEKASIRALCKIVETKMDADANETIYIAYGKNEKAAIALENQIHEHFPKLKIEKNNYTQIIATNIGPNGLGVAFLEKIM
ncbi:MAG: DegV family protein [Clostridia bacterium]